MMNSIFDVKKKFHLFSSLYSMNIDSYFGPRRVQITIIFLYLRDDSFFNSLFRLVLPFIQKIIQNHSFLLKTFLSIFSSHRFPAWILPEIEMALKYTLAQGIENHSFSSISQEGFLLRFFFSFEGMKFHSFSFRFFF